MCTNWSTGIAAECFAYALLKFGITAAVNSLRRDVVIKILQHGFPELAIFKKLALEPTRSHPLNYTIPILDILEYDENYSFAVMPR